MALRTIRKFTSWWKKYEDLFAQCGRAGGRHVVFGTCTIGYLFAGGHRTEAGRVIASHSRPARLDIHSDTVSAIVSETEVEYPNVNDFGITDTSVPGFPTPVTTVPVAIDAGADFLTIDFDNTAPFNRFVPAFQNTYIFTFESGIAPLITSAVIDTGVTTLGLVPEDITFAGNQLFVNVEGLFFNTSTFARINLTASPGTTPVPLPAGGALMLAGLLGLAALKRVRNRNASC